MLRVAEKAAKSMDDGDHVSAQGVVDERDRGSDHGLTRHAAPHTQVTITHQLTRATTASGMQHALEQGPIRLDRELERLA